MKGKSIVEQVKFAQQVQNPFFNDPVITQISFQSDANEESFSPQRNNQRQFELFSLVRQIVLLNRHKLLSDFSSFRIQNKFGSLK